MELIGGSIRVMLIQDISSKSLLRHGKETPAQPHSPTRMSSVTDVHSQGHGNLEAQEQLNGDTTLTKENSSLRTSAILMLVGVAFFIIYAVVFLFRSFYGTGFEIGVDTLNGVTMADLDQMDPAIGAYMAHLQVALSGFIMAASIAVGAIAWYGVRRGELWAWITAMGAPVIALIVALPLHYTGGFPHDWVTHIGPIYLGTLIFVIGGLMSLKVLMPR